MTPSTPRPLPYEQLLPLLTPCFKMFLEGSLNDPHPHHPNHPNSSILHCYPLHIHHPFPLKILIIHMLFANNRLREKHVNFDGKTQRKTCGNHQILRENLGKMKLEILYEPRRYGCRIYAFRSCIIVYGCSSNENSHKK